MQRHETPESIYPYTEWEVIEDGFNPAYNSRNETIFAIGNGYIGMRGNFEEGYSGPGLEGTYLNGFYESEDIHYPETAYGMAEKSQTMLNVTNGKIIRLVVDGEPFDMGSGEVRDYKRTLNFKTGLLERSLIWRSPAGHEVKIEVTRLVSLAHKHLAAVRFQVTPLNFDGEINLISMLDGSVTNLTAEDDPRLGSGLKERALLTEDTITDGNFAALRQRTNHTRFALITGMQNVLDADGASATESSKGEFSVSLTYTVSATHDHPVTLTKFLAYATSRDYAEAALFPLVRTTVKQASEKGFDFYAQEQTDFLAKFWDTSDLVIKGDPALQQGIRFNTYHLLQSVGRDGKTNISAKGLTGEGYEGHYFWDTEMYVLPFFQYSQPDVSRKLIEYRYSILDKARERARQMSHPNGALFAWRTINGEECSAYFPAGTAQYHIDADVAFAVHRYMDATNDTEFLKQYGAELLAETARFWADLGNYSPHKGNHFVINDVTGPDEYSAIVDNNCYTNLMARENLRYAVDAARWLQTNSPETYQTLAAKISLQASEIDDWQRAADAMYIPFDEQYGIYAQDNTFLDKEPWDFEHTPRENYPLLLHYHPLVIYRHQVCKQADFVLALFLLGNMFTADEKRKNYDYYEKVTTHDSSLSMCIFSIVASEIGYHDKAYTYFMNTARTDLDDIHGNVGAGVHIANMAGTWMCLVNGFAGMRAYNGVLSFSPYLPEGWEGYSFKIVYGGRVLGVTVDRASVSYALLSGDPLDIVHRGESVTVSGTVKLSL